LQEEISKKLEARREKSKKREEISEKEKARSEKREVKSFIVIKRYFLLFGLILVIPFWK